MSGVRCKSKMAAVSCTSRDKSTSVLQAAILGFRLPLTSDSVGSSSIEMLDPENVELAFEIAFLSSLQAEIKVLPVCRPPSWISDFRSHRTVLGVVPLRC